jgi:hypothetical protein
MNDERYAESIIVEFPSNRILNLFYVLEDRLDSKRGPKNIASVIPVIWRGSKILRSSGVMFWF